MNTYPSSPIEDNFRLIVENTSDGIITFNAMNQITYVSPGYTKLFGYSEIEEVSRTPDEVKQLIHPDDQERVFSEIFAAISNKQSDLKYTYQVKVKSGAYVWREDHARFNYDSSGKYLGCYVVARDISELKNYEILLNDKIKELKKTLDFITDRELKMIDLKQEIERLKSTQK